MRYASTLGSAALASALALGVAPAVHADAGPKFGDGLWLPVGINIGGAFRGDLPDGVVFGGEVSATYLWMEGEAGGSWVGAVADGVWDFGADAFRHRVGPELGWGPIGVDLAYLGQARAGRYEPGLSVRGVFTLAIVSLYGGYGHLFTDRDGPDFGEFGGLVKIPIPLDVEGRQPYPQPHIDEEPEGRPLEPARSRRSPPADGSGAGPDPAAPLVPVDPSPADEPDPQNPSPYATPPGEPDAAAPPSREPLPGTAPEQSPPPYAAPPADEPEPP